MPAYRFSWEAFDERTVVSLAHALGYDGPAAAARGWLSSAVKRPTPELVGEVKDVLVKVWLPEYGGTRQIVERLIDAQVGPLRPPRTQAGYVRYIDACRNSRRLRQYICEAMLRFGDVDRSSEDAEAALDFTPRFALLKPSAQPPDTRKPHRYQLEAWDRLSAHLAESRSTDVFQGLLVMPTGSGKTYTAVHWLCRHVLASGLRVLWLAHRHELLTHAAAEFHRLAGLTVPREKLRVRVVSGAHCATTQIDPADDVVIASVHSLARRPDIANELLYDRKMFVVIDEAHHAPAKSYRDIITELQRRKPWRILGLTATPTRTIEKERPILTRLFGGRVLAQVELARLVEQRILARPIPVIVRTNANVEEGVTEDDRKHYDTFNELSEEWLDRIARLTERNKLIVEHYLSARKKYGRTLIFAINVRHAALLAEDLRSSGVCADYVASYRPDGTPGDPDVIRQFRDGDLDVLVNVQIMTEGVDVPGIETVFLTRPTSSEILMRQMIGRALRGPAAGGSETAYLVSFEDHWERFRDWDSPFDLVPDIEAISDASKTDDPAIRIVDRFHEHLPWETIRAVAASVRQSAAEHKADAFEAVPEGWLVLERTEEDQGIFVPISIYAHQRPCWDALMARLESMSIEERNSTSASALYVDYFGDCDVPAPSPHQVGLVVEHYARGGEAPEYHDLVGRRECDPYEVARRVYTRNLGCRDASAMVESAYTSLAKAIYPNLREYQAAVDDALFELEHPDEATRMPRAVPIFDPRPDQQLQPGPAHDLQALMANVLEVGAKLCELPRLEYNGSLEWSTRILKGWYGIAYYRERPPRIKINCLLDSPDISAETMRFLLWHEFLHIHLAQGHTPTFRELERKWPGCVEADRELDNLNERFGVQYW